MVLQFYGSMLSLGGQKAQHHDFVYLSSSNRPVHEVLFPALRDIRHDYEHDFQGMTAEPVSLRTFPVMQRLDVFRVHFAVDVIELRINSSVVEIGKRMLWFTN